MPFFSGKSKTSAGNAASKQKDKFISTKIKISDPKPVSTFNCKLAHGSPNRFIKVVRNYSDLYKKIARCFDLHVDDILFCTLNTHSVDMTKLLSGGVGLNDVIFAHCKGRSYEIELINHKPGMRVILTDNGAGYSLIKRYKDGCPIKSSRLIFPGDHIEKINDVSVVGKRHYEVAHLLKKIPVGATFTLCVTEPIRCGQCQGSGPCPKISESVDHSFGCGLKANGDEAMEDEYDTFKKEAIMAISHLLESFVGIADEQLAAQIWKLVASKTNPQEFAEAIDNSDLESFAFPDEFIFDLWCATNNARCNKEHKI